MFKYQIRYFASLREQLGSEGECLESDTPLATVAALIELLAAKHGEGFAAHLRAKNILVAINHQMAQSSQELSPNDEVAFFPPVTGG